MRLHELCYALIEHPIGRSQLVSAGLVPEGIPPPRTDGDGQAGDEDLENMFVDNGGSGGTRRSGMEHSEEEEHMRRRHRQAMVINDGTRPLSRGDIFQREGSERHAEARGWGDFSRS